MAEDKKNVNQTAQQPVENNAPETVDFEDVFLTRGQLMWRAFKKNKLAMVGMWVLIVMYIAMVFADFLAPYKIHSLRT